MIRAEMIDGPLDRSPATMLIGEIFGTGCTTTWPPAGAIDLIRETSVEVFRLASGVSRQSAQDPAGFIEYRAFDSPRDVGRQLVRMRIIASVAQSLEQAPIARRDEIITPLPTQPEAPLDATCEVAHAMTELLDQLVEFGIGLGINLVGFHRRAE